MKGTKISYWIATVVVAVMMLFSAYSYLTKAEIAPGFTHLGFPGYFRVELAIFKILGALVLLAPAPPHAKEWAYAGFTFTFISAFIAHSASGDPVGIRMMPVVFLVILAVSYFAYHRLPATAAA